MKLLSIIASVDPDSGGPVEGIRRQQEVFDRLGLATRDVVTTDRPEAPYIADFPMRVHALGLRAEDDRRNRFQKHYGYTPHLVPWLKANAGNYDAVFVHGLWNFAPHAASKALAKSKLPYFVFTHGMLDPWFKKTYPLKHLIKQAFWLNGEGPLLSGARSVFFTSEEERQLARGMFIGHNDYRGTVIGYGTTEPPAATEAQTEAFGALCPEVGTKPYLLFMSRIHPKKGCDLLVQAFAEVATESPELQLVIGGPDQTGWVAELKAMAQKLGVGSRVHFPGGLFGAAKWGAVRGAEAFVLPSHQENFGIVVAEALACAKPVLISDKVNIWREIEADGAGIVAPDTLEGTLKLLKSWRAKSASDQASMALKARECFARRFDVNNTGPDLLETIRKQL